MKQILATAIVLLASLLSFPSASAQTVGGRVEIPFSFTAGNTKLPAGVYFLKAEGNRTTLSGEGTFWAAYINPNMPSGYGKPDKVEIVFSVYGDQHFLREIEYGPGDVRYRLPFSKTERRVRQQTPVVLGN